MMLTQMHPKQAHFEQALHLFFDQCHFPARRLQEAMRYMLFPGGKRLRPLLIYATGELFNLSLTQLDPIAIAIELMHAYSLIHDDLPAMDNDDFRRGLPSCHKAFDEATAILAGDALHALAIQALIHPSQPDISVRQIDILLQATGPMGMISGQSLDLTLLAKNDALNESQLQQIHHLKTAELLLACINMPLVCLPPPVREPYRSLQDFAMILGLAYQMQDDYLDAYHAQTHGKGQASDQENHKTTFASLYPQQVLKTRIQTLFTELQQSLLVFGEQASGLHEILKMMNKIRD